MPKPEKVKELRTVAGAASLVENILYFGEDFHGAEGFYDILVRTDLTAPFLFGCLPFCRQHDNIGVFDLGFVFYNAADVIPVYLRHHDVEEQYVRSDFPDDS